MHRTARNAKALKAGPRAGHMGRRWQLQDAKARFSQVIRDSQKTPQIITFRGEEIAVVQSMKDYRNGQFAKSGDGPNLLEVLLKCPPGPPLVIDRDPNDVVGTRTASIFD